MKKLLVIILFLCGVASGVNAEMIFLIKISDFDNIISYELMTAPEIRERTASISAVNKNYTKALRLAKEAWKNDPTVMNKPFPQSRFKKKEISRVRSFVKREEADKALTEIQVYAERMNAELARPSTAGQGNPELQKLLGKGGSGGGKKGKKGGGSKNKKNSQGDKARAAQRKKKAEEVFALETKAIEMFKSAIGSL
ncbi:hypothetical protein ACFLS1_07835 [Verrucomicrobiota bacterium]